MIQRYDLGELAKHYASDKDNVVCRGYDVDRLEAKYADLEAKYAKLDKHCLALFYAVCGLTCQDMTGEERADALQDANEAKSRFADDPDFWHIVDLDDNDGGDQ